MEGHTALTTGRPARSSATFRQQCSCPDLQRTGAAFWWAPTLGGLGTPIASLAALISLKVYLRTPGARPGRYLLLFTAANGAALVLLCLCAALLAG